MNEKALKTLEYNKIKNKLIEFAISPMAKEKIQQLTPFTDMSEIITAQKETTQAVSMSLRKGRLPLGQLHEIRPQIKRAYMNGILSIDELLNIGEFLYICRKAKKYAENENKSESYDILDGIFELIEVIPTLENEINRCIISEIEISDNASNELRNVRRNIKIANERIKEHLNTVINSSTYRNMLQDFVITIRNDRYCVPVKNEYRANFPGMVHDQSNTGSTVFIEPMSVVELNNKIKELQTKEKEEIDKILEMLSNMVTENCDIIKSNLELITQLDFIFAKAQLSLSMKGIQPLFNTRGYINIKKARHPLIDDDKVVPINIYLGKDFTTLLITGPNTGGKTVALKTLGLFTLMGQSGLHIPAFDNSQLAVFDNVFSDIGDEQSIEQNLSTFSAHMSNVIKILEDVTNNSLVLFDELGAGTDPTEGAALALAIIKHLFDRKIRTAITTHYSELKVYALSNDGIENACCEFDVETLKPTYKLLIGVPGKSNAFAISKRLGLQDYIIESAKEFIDHEDVRLEDVITDLEISKKSVDFEKERAETYRFEAENLKKEIERQKEKIQKQKEKILLRAKEEAMEILQKAKNDADSIIKEINRQAKENSGQHKLNESRAKLKKQLESIQSDVMKNVNKKIINSRPIESLKVGDRVYVISFDQSGTAVSLPDNNNEVMVQTGFMKIKVPLNELMIDETKAKEDKNNYAKITSNVKAGKSQFISTQIDCRGQLVNEALENIDKYMDDAYLAGLKEIMIIHGKGTGALRSGVWDYLKKNPHVQSYRQGKYGEGELGVTVVELK